MDTDRAVATEEVGAEIYLAGVAATSMNNLGVTLQAPAEEARHVEPLV